MGLVGGSRHYTGGGLGEAPWTCPSCGAENTGPLSQGCQLCGAGKPGKHIDPDDSHRPPPSPPAPAAAAGPGQHWALRNPTATLAEAWEAGYLAGAREADEKHREIERQRAAARRFDPTHAPARTILAALELFRDQVLAGNPEEVATGEWLSVSAVEQVMAQIRASIPQGELAHV
jgi:hypothetical protein